jgi:hypothetical protein
MAGMASADESAMPFAGLFPTVMGALGYRGRAMVMQTPFLIPLHKSEARVRV